MDTEKTNAETEKLAWDCLVTFLKHDEDDVKLRAADLILAHLGVRERSMRQE